jgi:hypothetical protein
MQKFEVYFTHNNRNMRQLVEAPTKGKAGYIVRQQHDKAHVTSIKVFDNILY